VAKPKVLLVDADLKSRQMLEISLKKAGLTVTNAESGEKALQLLETLQPDLIISDIDLGGAMDGFVFCEVLKEQSATRGIPFLFLTKRKQVEDKVRGLELGVDDYLTKPIYLKEVIARVRLILDKKRQVDMESTGPDPQFQGDLSQMSVVDLLQTMEFGQKTGVLHLEHGRHRAKFFVRGGRIVHAVTGNLVGERAVYRALLWNEGTFRIDFGSAAAQQETIEVSTQALIMEGMRRIDETERLKEQLPPFDTVLAIDSQTILEEHPDRFPAKIENILAEFDGESNLDEIIERLPYDDLESLEIVSKLYFQGFLMEIEAFDEPATAEAPAGEETQGTETSLRGGATLDTERLQLDDTARSIEDIKRKAKLKSAASEQSPESPQAPGEPPPTDPPEAEESGFELAPPSHEDTEPAQEPPQASPPPQPPERPAARADSPPKSSPRERAAPPEGSARVVRGGGVTAANVVPIPRGSEAVEAAEHTPPEKAPATQPAPQTPPEQGKRTWPWVVVVGMLLVVGGAAGYAVWQDQQGGGAGVQMSTDTDRAASTVARAQNLLAQEQWASALRLADDAVALDAESPVAHAVRGRALTELGRTQDAVAAFERALSLNPAAHDVRYAVLSLRFEQGEDPAQIGEDVDSLLLRMNPNRHARTYLNSLILAAKTDISEKEWGQARTRLAAARRMTDGEDARVTALAAQLPSEPAEEKPREPQRAEKQPAPQEPAPAAAASTQKPQPRPQPKASPEPDAEQASQDRQARALFKKGDRFYRKGYLREAKRSLEQAVQLDPQKAAYWILLGQVLVELGDDEGAEEAFLNAGEQDPENPDVYLSLGTLYQLQGDVSRARRAFQAYLDLVPGDSREAQEIRKIVDNL